MKITIGVDARGRRTGQWHPRAKLTDREVDQLRALRESDPVAWTFAALAEKFEITKRHAKRLCDYSQRDAAPAEYRTVSLA